MKWQERINKILDNERIKIEAKLSEAQGNYNDTGYQRYYNQMERLEAELTDIDNFLHSARNVAGAESEARRYRKGIYDFRKKMEDYALYHKGIERPIEETVKELRIRLDTAMGEAGAKL